jgi:hypothetical protein
VRRGSVEYNTRQMAGEMSDQDSLPDARLGEVAEPYVSELYPVRIRADFEPSSLPVHVISTTVWRQSAVGFPPLSLPPRAATRGRFHRRGQAPPLYASSTRDAAWGELFRHVPSGLSPFEIRRRMARVRVTNLPVLDLTDPHTLALLGIPRQELVGDRYKLTQQIASLARRRLERFGGILAPSAADPSATTLVIFPEWLARAAVVERHRVSKAPVRLVELFEQVIGTLVLSAQDEAMATLREIRSELRRARRRLGR